MSTTFPTARAGATSTSPRSGSHLGTHVDAPLHYGSRCEGAPARTITDVALGELYLPGVVLDVRGAARPGEAVPTAALLDAVVACGPPLPERSAMLVRTGQEAYDLDDPRFVTYPGMSREGTLVLAKLGGKVLGTDARWDRPFLVMAEAFHRTGDRGQIWDGHFAGRDREVFIVQQLTNPAALPASGFMVGCFPLRLARASAAPAPGPADRRPPRVRRATPAPPTGRASGRHDRPPPAAR